MRWSSLLADLFSPRVCAVCGRRLEADEYMLCSYCSWFMPRTHFEVDPVNNTMARLFWGRVKIERAAAFVYFDAGAELCNVIYSLKYNSNKLAGERLGHMMAANLLESGFFEGIDAIVPVPLSPNRLRQRTYNQSELLSRGIRRVTHLPVYPNALSRQKFKVSQTHEDRWQRADNVSNQFVLNEKYKQKLADKHLLLVDDVVTTGATASECGRTLLAIPGARLSILSWGVARL